VRGRGGDRGGKRGAQEALFWRSTRRTPRECPPSRGRVQEGSFRPPLSERRGPRPGGDDSPRETRPRSSSLDTCSGRQCSSRTGTATRGGRARHPTPGGAPLAGKARGRGHEGRKIGWRRRSHPETTAQSPMRRRDAPPGGPGEPMTPPQPYRDSVPLPGLRRGLRRIAAGRPVSIARTFVNNGNDAGPGGPSTCYATTRTVAVGGSGSIPARIAPQDTGPRVYSGGMCICGIYLLSSPNFATRGLDPRAPASSGLAGWGIPHVCAGTGSSAEPAHPKASPPAAPPCTRTLLLLLRPSR